MNKEFIKSGEAVRENKKMKSRPDLIPPEMILRLGDHYARGAKSHGVDNWKGGDRDFAEGCKASAYRHLIAWLQGKKDEDHAMAMVRNIFTYEALTEHFDFIDEQIKDVLISLGIEEYI